MSDTRGSSFPYECHSLTIRIKTLVHDEHALMIIGVYEKFNFRMQCLSDSAINNNELHVSFLIINHFMRQWLQSKRYALKTRFILRSLSCQILSG